MCLYLDTVVGKNAPVLVKVPTIPSEMGSLSIVEAMDDIPFEIQRIYFLHKVPNNGGRGAHAHKELWQLMISMSSNFTVVLNDGLGSVTSFTLDNPEQGLLVPPGYWRDLVNFGPNAVCLVLASLKYDESDYIRDFELFVDWAKLNANSIL